MLSKIARHISWRLTNALQIQIPQWLYAQFLDKKVYAGPFTGMNYIGGSTGSVILPKIVGTYEDELTAVLTTIQTKSYNKFLDIGAAEGYFAVGITKYILKNEIATIAYEATEKGRMQILELASKNQVSSIEVKGFCTRDNMYQDLVPNSLIWMDIEGGEDSLLTNPEPVLNTCDILVELHPSIVPNIREKVFETFSETHLIQEINIGRKHFPSHIKLPSFLKGKEEYLMNEFRGPQSWLWLQSKAR